MNITTFEVIPFSIPFVTPLQTAGNTYTHREGLWLKLQYGEVIGVGDAAPLRGFSNESLKEVHYSLEGFHQAVEGENIEVDDLIQLAVVHTLDIPAARFALESAIYDLAAKTARLPLAKYLNPNALSSIKVNGITGRNSPEDGFQIIKVKVGFRNLFDEIENLVELTQAFGKDVKFRLDANGAFDLVRAIRFCKEMEAFNIDYIEQPLPKEELVDMAELRYHTEIPIAVDESLTDLNSAEKIIDEQAVDVFIIKPMVSGGFTDCEKIINLARVENIRTVITTSLESVVGRTACLHLAAAYEITEACGLATAGFLNEEDQNPLIENGVIKLSNNPGLGIEI